jgi:predicted phage terminase large subunit-like protein
MTTAIDPAAFPDPLGRSHDEPLDRERHGFEFLDRVRRTTARFYASIWGQDPRPAGGSYIRGEWFKYLSVLPAETDLTIVRAWDLAYTSKELSKGDPDYTAGALVALWRPGDTTERFVIIHMSRSQVRWTDAKRRILDTAQIDGYDIDIGVETGGGNAAAYDELITAEGAAGYVIEGLQPVRDKVARAQWWIDRAESGLVYLMTGEWNRDFIDECEAFDTGAHDDQIDAVSLGMFMLAERGAEVQQGESFLSAFRG